MPTDAGAFMRPDEYIIIMDQGTNELLPDELVMLRDAGIQTIYYNAAVRWNQVQPRPGAMYLEHLDDYVEQIERAGLKALLGFFHTMPMWKPDDWYHTRDCTGIFSYTNPETAADIDAMAQFIIDRYRGRPVQLVYAMPFDGEFPCSFKPKIGRPLPDAVIRDFVVGRQRVLEPQFNEIWTAFHHSCLPPYLVPTHEALVETFPNSNHYTLQYTFWDHGPRVKIAAQAVQERLGVQTYVGSEYCDGLKQYTAGAIERGLRFITCPIHTFQPHRRIETWMLDNIRDSLRQFEEAAS